MSVTKIVREQRSGQPFTGWGPVLLDKVIPIQWTYRRNREVIGIETQTDKDRVVRWNAP